MPILAWIVVGLIGGFVGSMIVNKRGQGPLGDVFLGVIGSVVGGWALKRFGHSGVTGMNLYSIVVSAIGTIMVLGVYHALRRAQARVIATNRAAPKPAGRPTQG
jgi:uncharacterized membrane protein YeaQ/YmgE (transglycosylase-associated protein family)